MPIEYGYNDKVHTRSTMAVALILLGFLIASIVLGLRVERGDVSAPVRTAVAFVEPNLTAKAVYVYDVHTGEAIFAKNEDTRMPLASLTKVMSALVASELASYESTVVVSNEALGAYGDSGLEINERWSLRDLLDFSLITSSNDGMRAVALTLGALNKESASDDPMTTFIEQMNIKASEIGLHNTYFWNETGLDVPTQTGPEIMGGAYGTARDMALLLEYILAHHPELLSATKEASTSIYSLDNISHTAKNTNKVVYDIPGLVASKTGFTDIAGGNLVFVFDPELGRPIVVSILGSTTEGRFSDALALVQSTLEYLNQQ